MKNTLVASVVALVVIAVGSLVYASKANALGQTEEGILYGLGIY